MIIEVGGILGALCCFIGILKEGAILFRIDVPAVIIFPINFGVDHGLIEPWVIIDGTVKFTGHLTPELRRR